MSGGGKTPATLPQDHLVRDEIASKLDVSFAVEAGAGTGKTTLIVRRIVAHVQRGDPIESIVAITFTKKAAAELRVRVRTALERILVESGANDHVENALRRIDAAPIQTIHSFCDSLLREHPVEAAIDPMAETLEEAASSPLFAEVFEEAIETAEGDGDLADLFAAGIEIVDLEKLAHVVIRARDLPFEDPAPPPLPDVVPLWRRANELATRADEIVRAECNEPDDDLADRIRSYRDGLLGLFELERSAQERALFRGFGTVPRKRLGAAKNWRSAASKEDAHRLLIEIDDELEAYRAIVRVRRAATAFRFARRCVRIHEEKKVRDGVLDFEDQLLKTRDLLRDHPAVRAEIGRRFRTLIVDEFQDTDPLQAEIAFFLAEDVNTAPRAKSWADVQIGPGRLVVVGDPKQSIYRFRRADIEVYELAKEKIAACGGRLEKIRVNFRSEASILEFVNARFSELIRPHPEIPRIQPEYVPLIASPESADLDTRCGGRRRVVVLEEATDFSGVNVEALRDREFGAIAAYIVRLVRGERPFMVRDSRTKDERPARLSDVAILFRSSTGLEQLENALKNESLGYRVVGGKRFYLRVEVKTVIALFRALDDATDEVALLATLRGALFAVSDDDLAEFVASSGSFQDPFATGRPSERLKGALEILKALRARRHAGSLASFVDEALAATRAYEIFSLFRDGAQRTANLDKIVAVARAFEGATGETFRRFVAEIDRMSSDAEREPEAEFQDDDDDAIVLISMHSAKGLEWPIVVLANLAGAPNNKKDPIVERTPAPRLEFVKGAEGAHVCATAHYEQAERIDLQREACERRRLLYVAATRARDLLVLPRYQIAKKKPKSGEEAGDAAKKSPLIADLVDDPFYSGATVAYGARVDAATLPRSAPLESPFRVDVDLDAPLPPAAASALLEREKFAAHVRARLASTQSGRVVRSASAEKAALEHEEDGDSGEAEVRAIVPARASTGFAGVEFGTFVHRVFEHLDFACADDSALPSLAVVNALAAEGGLPRAAATEAVRIAKEFLRSPIAVALRAAKRVHREVPFALTVDGALAEGAIDLVVEFHDGRLWVVDWKTDDVEGAALDARFQAYRPQGALYRRAVETVSGRAVERVCFHFLRSGASRDL